MKAQGMQATACDEMKAMGGMMGGMGNMMDAGKLTPQEMENMSKMMGASSDEESELERRYHENRLSRRS